MDMGHNVNSFFTVFWPSIFAEEPQSYFFPSFSVFNLTLLQKVVWEFFHIAVKSVRDEKSRSVEDEVVLLERDLCD